MTSSARAVATASRDREGAARLVPTATSGRPSAEDELARHVQSFVASAFFGTMLKQMRESPFRSELFGGGRGGQAYDAMYHQVLAERMGRGVGQGLVRAIVKRIAGARGKGGLPPPRDVGKQLQLTA